MIFVRINPNGEVGSTGNSDGVNNNRYRVYGSKEAHSSIEKAVKIIGDGSNFFR